MYKYGTITFGEPIVVPITITKRNLTMRNHRILSREAALIFLLFTPIDIIYADKDMTVKLISTSFEIND